MFTPPPSPLPTPTHSPNKEDAVTPQSRVEAKRRIGRRTRWTVLAVPFILVLITTSTRYITHPIALSSLDSTISDLWPRDSDRTRRQPHLEPRQSSAAAGSTDSPSGTTSATGTTTTAAAAQPLPNVPSSAAILPTPFPQPFDADLTQNFSSVTCFNFFTNMTNTVPFRSCRPFSLLLSSSAAMVDAQTNLTLMNSIVWGTCNTTVSESQCGANMSWFASELQNACSQDLSDRNAMATGTLKALQAFEVMHQTGCLVDPTTNTYCYLDAVHNTNPSDLYYYMLPLGSSLPTSSRSSCSACTRSLMSIYGSAMGNSSSPVSGLDETYNDAAQQAITECGQSFATLAANGSSRMLLPTTTALLFGLLVVLLFQS